MIQTFNPPNLSDFQKRSLIVGGVFALAFIAGAFLDSHHFFQAYLIGWTFWTGITLGSLALLMLQHLTGGGWGFVIRRVLEASTRTLPVMAILFLPIGLGAYQLYHHWLDKEELAKHPVVKFKTPYLNLPFFSARAVIYFAVWLLLVFLLNRWSLAQDRTADNRYTKNMRDLSGPGMVLLIVTITFASVDWYMSLEPEWFSTIFGFIWVAAWSLSALAFVIAVMASLANEEPMKRIVAPLHFHDLGKLLLALVMLWSYFAYSQYLIIWSANLPEEIGYYIERTHGVWGAVIIIIAILHFGTPFLFLLSRNFKRNPRKLVLIALLILGMRAVDLLWMLLPAFKQQLAWIWLDIVALIAFGGVWLGLFSWQLSKRPLIPINDPQFESVMEQAHAGDH
jgi:hypothetical protein